MLEGSDLHCERGGKDLFRGLSLALKEGELLRVAGANGRGKTSLLRILCGLLAPVAGEVRWKGEPIRALREDYATQLVYLGHEPAVKGELTAAENLEIACRLAGFSAAAGEALGTFGVPADVPVKKLSQGQRRRAALARLAVSGKVPLWILDEPFAALDGDAVRLVEDLVSKHVAQGGIAVLTTHQESRLGGRALSLDG